MYKRDGQKFLHADGNILSCYRLQQGRIKNNGSNFKRVLRLILFVLNKILA